MTREQRKRNRTRTPARRDEPGCSGKVRYLTAVEAVRYGLVSRGVLVGERVLRAYECDACARWHLSKETEIPRFMLEESTMPTTKPNLLTVSFTLPHGFQAEDLEPALAQAKAAGVAVFGDVDLRSHVSFPHRSEGGVDLAIVSIHPAPVAAMPDEPTEGGPDA